MQSLNKDNDAFSMGLGSMVGYLSTIAENTTETNNWLEKIFDYVEELRDSLYENVEEKSSFVDKYFGGTIVNIVRQLDIFNKRNKELLTEIRDGINVLASRPGQLNLQQNVQQTVNNQTNPQPVSVNNIYNSTKP